MKISVSANYDEMSAAAGSFIIQFLNENVQKRWLCFAAGNSPLGIFKYLVQAFRQGRIHFGAANFVSLDEWVGMDATDSGSCRNTLDKHFFKPLGIAETQIYFFDGKSADLKGECDRMNATLKRRGPLDLILLGLGLNGHLGFNEPGTSSQALCHCSALQTSTREFGQKYFRTKKDLNRGLTLGLKQIGDAKLIVLVVSGRRKAAIVRKLLQEGPTEEIPATALRSHPDCHLFLDREASSEVSL